MSDKCEFTENIENSNRVAEKKSLFRQPINILRGVGGKNSAIFAKLGIKTVGDLLLFYPRSYEDWNCIHSIASAPLTEICCIKAVVCSSVCTSTSSGGINLQKLQVCDETAQMTITFFNNKFVNKQLQMGKHYMFYGKIKYGYTGKEMLSPKFASAEKEVCINPIYTQTDGLSSKKVASLVRQAIDMLPQNLGEPLSWQIRDRYNLCDLGFALKNIHFPQNERGLCKARKRLIFEESLTLQLGFAHKRNISKKQENSPIINDFSCEFINSLEFSLTKAQLRCINECMADMKTSGLCMNRLIQGDVGSGKTVVAAALCYSIAKNNMQAAIMAPTEVLAQQHYQYFCELFPQMNVAILTGGFGKKKRREILFNLQNGETDIIIGTHALLSKDVAFCNLGLVVTDEQQRFGVAQRGSLASKCSHVLVMSATPIPRTLAMIIYGDLDISVLDELPPGRQCIETMLVTGKKRGQIYALLKHLISQGLQGYIVCPVIQDEATDEEQINSSKPAANKAGLAAATEYFEKLKQEDFYGYNISLMHGKMNASEKDDVMAEFSGGKSSVLVSTTVIEVGVNVPSAAFMLIENAERFGLSQLHQLRGRVGRGHAKSYCILLSDSQNDDSLRRLNVLRNTHDGFKIADEDLKIRGPGEFLGHKQHGLPSLKIAKFSSDIQIFKQTQKLAQEILVQDPSLELPENRFLKAQMKLMFKNSEKDYLGQVL